MMKFNKNGYLASKPLKPEQWRSIAPGLPAGRIATDNTTPPGFLLIQGFIPDSVCNTLVQECNREAGVDTTILEEAKAERGLVSLQSEARLSQSVDVRKLKTDVISIVQHTYGNVIAPHFGTQIDWFELPEILRYNPGGEYKSHADADNWDMEMQEWRRVQDRDLSMLIYLNDDYSGGEVDFHNFGLRLKPKRGLLIAFPSDCRYVHAARPVTSGVRYALVAWAAIKGSQRVKSAPPEHAHQM